MLTVLEYRKLLELLGLESFAFALNGRTELIGVYFEETVYAWEQIFEYTKLVREL